MSITLYNTLTRRKEPLAPLDPNNVRMYVCGPTVYDYAHIGNARPVIVFDVLFRLLRQVYGPDHVTYARNITDVDDKINARAAEERVTIRELTERTAAQFHADIAALGVLPPTVEPRATEHIPEMRALCEALVEKGHAYVADGHVLFDVSLDGRLRPPRQPQPGGDGGRRARRGRALQEGADGLRAVEAVRKPQAEPSWPSPCGIARQGRPGWHLECSAMSEKHLGQVFDIHGGGIDLVFPHHENEIAQSRCAHGTPVMAQRVDAQRLPAGRRREDVEVARQLHHHQRAAGDAEVRRPAVAWPRRPARHARHALSQPDRLDGRAAGAGARHAGRAGRDACRAWRRPARRMPMWWPRSRTISTRRSAISIIHGLAKSARRGNAETAAELKARCSSWGSTTTRRRTRSSSARRRRRSTPAEIERLIQARLDARKARDFKEADRIRDDARRQGHAAEGRQGPARPGRSSRRGRCGDDRRAARPLPSRCSQRIGCLHYGCA